MKTIRIDDPQELDELRRGGAKVVKVSAKPAQVELPAPPAPDLNALTAAIVQALQHAPKQARPVSWKFDVQRDSRGLIQSILAYPAEH